MSPMEIALFGNPNTGKTSLFNMLTGSYEYVGNWTGVTVEKKVGTLKKGKDLLIDLPGVYSLNPLSKDETIASRFLLEDPFDAIVNIVDASQLLRNLQLTVQLIELGKPMVLGLNMMDVAKSRGIQINPGRLSKRLGIPVLGIIARTGKGCQELSHSMLDHRVVPEPFLIDYGPEVEEAITNLLSKIPEQYSINPRWLAVQFLEGNPVVREELQGLVDLTKIQLILEELTKKIKANYNETTIRQFIYKKRQELIQDILKDCTIQTKAGTVTLTDRIDAIVTNRYLGLIIFLGFMYLMFELTFDWLGTPLSNWLDLLLTGPIAHGTTYLLNLVHASIFIKKVILDGIIGGVGGVLIFIPQIFILFFFISLLEDSGYMARIAMVMDRVMELVGLNGKAFIPLIIGFGCNVPGVMASRTIEQPKERLLTTLLTPLMSCSARLSVYSLFVAAFFKSNQALIVLSLYVLGIVVAIVLAKVFSLFIKSEGSIFVIELPPYRVPQFQTLMRSTWDKGKGFVKKAGTIIFGGTILIWLLSYVGPHGLDVSIDESFLAKISGWFAPIFAPLGFGTWQAGAALITGFLAKEIVVTTMNVIYFVPDGGTLTSVISHVFTPLSAYSFMVFILLYVPCLSTVATIQKETGSKKWMLFSIVYGLIVAYIMTWIIYHIGLWLHIGI